jgi:hypothetical protein
VICIDFETKSYADLTKVGAWAYSEDPSTMPICLCYGIDYEPVRTWVPGDEDPTDLFDAIAAGKPVEAHNVSFEISIWKNVMVKRFGWPDVPLELWRDTAAVAAYYALPTKLDKLAKLLGYGGKDVDGGRLISKYSKLHLKSAKPVIPPEDLKRFVEYCKRDVELEQAVSDYLGDLPDEELKVFQLDLKIELRGLRIDLEGVDAATKVVEEYGKVLDGEFRKLTGFGPGQLDKVHAWFEERGYPLENMQAEYLGDALKEGLEIEEGVFKPVVGDARRALELRLATSKASVKKLMKMRGQRGSDGTAKFQCRYHGAQTGRWTGTGFQPLNLNRGYDKKRTTPEDLVFNIKTGNWRWVKAMYGNPIDAVARASRHWIISSDGHEIMAGDFVSIEAVVLACLAQERWKVEAFRQKKGIYELMACKIYNLDPELASNPEEFKKAYATERQDGKTCFAAGTQVLTCFGWKDIVSVTSKDLVWDGVEWVSTGGAVCQGAKETINMAGVEVTPDHLVLTGYERWITAREVASSASMMLRALEKGSENLPFAASSSGQWAGFLGCGSDALAEPTPTWYPSLTSGVARQPGATDARSSRPRSTGRTTTSTQTYAPTTGTAGGCSTASRRALLAAVLRDIRTTAGAASAYINLGQKALKGAVRFFNTSLASLAGTIRRWRSTASTLTEITPRATCVSILAAREKNEPCRSCNNGLQNLRPVYDVVNAGPRNRFTILTDEGPMIVHNCELAFGYQGGLNAWLNFDSSGRHTDERIVEICKAWRAEHPEIVKFWSGIERAAVDCVMHHETTYYMAIQFDMIDEWLAMTLPDGKKIWYREPYLRQKMPPWHRPVDNKFGPAKPACAAGTCDCEPQPELCYLAVKGGRVQRTSTYGGKLTENAVQATARQILKPAMLRLDDEGFPIVLSVYDEIVCDVPAGFATLKDFEDLIREREGWFKDWPIDVDAWQGKIYRK